MKTKYKNLEIFNIFFISSNGNSLKSLHFQKISFISFFGEILLIK